MAIIRQPPDSQIIFAAHKQCLESSAGLLYRTAALPHCCVQILSLTTATEKSCRVQDLNSEPKFAVNL